MLRGHTVEVLGGGDTGRTLSGPSGHFPASPPDMLNCRMCLYNIRVCSHLPVAVALITVLAT